MAEIVKTNISEIYDNFLTKISDYSFLELLPEEMEEELFGYFKSARTKFYKCKNSLATSVNELGETIIDSQLHPFEIEILTTYMLVEYLKPQVLSSEALKQLMSDKDFKVHSQANQLRELTLVYRNFKKEADKMVVEYTYFNLNEEKM